MLLATFAWLAPQPSTTTSETRVAIASHPAATVPDAPVATATIRAVLHERCGACHAAQPQLLGAPPKGLVFDSDAAIDTHAAQILQQTVMLRIMPPGNLTGMTDPERELIARWYRQRQ